MSPFVILCRERLMRFSQQLPVDHLVLEPDEDEDGRSEIADPAGADHDALKCPPAVMSWVLPGSASETHSGTPDGADRA
jgi:hypothetical protein